MRWAITVVAANIVWASLIHLNLRQSRVEGRATNLVNLPYGRSQILSQAEITRRWHDRDGNLRVFAGWEITMAHARHEVITRSVYPWPQHTSSR